MSDDRKLAMFIDFENIVRGVKEAQYKAFEIKLVLERLVEKGKIMVKRAYADWSRYQEYKRPFHEHAVELIDVPQSRYSGQELCGHPHGRGCHGPGLREAARGHLRARIRAIPTSPRSCPSCARTTAT